MNDPDLFLKFPTAWHSNPSVAGWVGEGDDEETEGGGNANDTKPSYTSLDSTTVSQSKQQTGKGRRKRSLLGASSKRVLVGLEANVVAEGRGVGSNDSKSYT